MRSRSSHTAALLAALVVGGLAACAPRPAEAPQARLQPLEAAASASAFAHARERLRDTDGDTPFYDDGYLYYVRVEDDGARLRCRRAARSGSAEEVLFREDELARASGAPSTWDRRAFVGALDASPDQRFIAVTADDGADRWRLFVKDLATGVVLGPVEGADFSMAWDRDNTLYYAALDERAAPATVVALEPAAPERRRVVHVERAREDALLVAPIDDYAAVFVHGPRGLAGFRLRAPPPSSPGGELDAAPAAGGVGIGSARTREIPAAR